MSKSRVSRRNFLTAMGVGTAAAAAAVVSKTGSDAKPAPTAGKEQSKGYQLTEHVRNYYRTAKV